jgi:hypothetical protein
LGTQHFNTHVGTAAAIAYDGKDGLIGWQGSGISNDYSILNGFCPEVGGTGSLPPTTAFLHIALRGCGRRS